MWCCFWTRVDVRGLTVCVQCRSSSGAVAASVLPLPACLHARPSGQRHKPYAATPHNRPTPAPTRGLPWKAHGGRQHPTDKHMPHC